MLSFGGKSSWGWGSLGKSGEGSCCGSAGSIGVSCGLGVGVDCGVACDISVVWDVWVWGCESSSGPVLRFFKSRVGISNSCD